MPGNAEPYPDALTAEETAEFTQGRRIGYLGAMCIRATAQALEDAIERAERAEARVAELEQKNALLRHRLTLRRSWARAMRKALLEERVLLGVAEAELASAKALTKELEAMQAGPQSETVGKLLDLAHDLGADDDRALCEEAAARLQTLERELEISADRALPRATLDVLRRAYCGKAHWGSETASTLLRVGMVRDEPNADGYAELTDWALAKVEDDLATEREGEQG